MRVTATDSSLAVGPANSPTVGRLFYLGEGLALGGILYFALYLVWLPLSDLLDGVGFWVAALALVAFLAIGVRNAAAVLHAGRSGDGRQPPIYEEWVEIRRWSWLLAIGAVVAFVVFGATVLVVNPQSAPFFQEAALVTTSLLFVGIVLRMAVRVLVT